MNVQSCTSQIVENTVVTYLHHRTVTILGIDPDGIASVVESPIEIDTMCLYIENHAAVGVQAAIPAQNARGPCELAVDGEVPWPCECAARQREISGDGGG